MRRVVLDEAHSLLAHLPRPQVHSIPVNRYDTHVPAAETSVLLSPVRMTVFHIDFSAVQSLVRHHVLPFTSARAYFFVGVCANH